MWLLFSEFRPEFDKGIAWFQEYVNEIENIEILLKCIYISKLNNSKMGDVSGLCCKKVIADLIQDGLILTFLSNKGWKEYMNIDILNHGSDFTNVYLWKLLRD